MSSFGNISQLTHNLGTLGALQDAREIDRTLIAGYDGCLYAKTSALGRVWMWILSTQACLSGKEDLAHKLRLHTISETHTSFCNTLALASRTGDAYRTYLLEGKSEQLPGARRALIDLSDVLASFVDYHGDGAPSLRIKKFQRLFHQTIEQKLCTADDKELLRKSIRTDAMIAIEGIVQRALPLRSFEALLSGSPLSQYDTEALEEWIGMIQQNRKNLTPGLLHNALWGAVEMIVCTGERNVLPAVSALEWLLFQGGCTLLDEVDPGQLAFVDGRSTLGLPCDTRGEIVLGEPLALFGIASLGIRLFCCKNSDHMIMIGKNPAQLGIWERACIEEGWAVLPITIYSRDKEGRYLVTEKIISSLSRHRWYSRFARIAEVDKALLDNIARLIVLFVQTREIPQDLDPDHIFVGANSALRVLAPLQRNRSQPFDLYRLERFVHEVSQGIAPIRRYLMHQSGLISHPSACWLYACMEAHLSSQIPDLDIEDDAALHNIDDTELVGAATCLLPQLKEAHELLFAKLVKQLSCEASGHALLRQRIAETLSELYKEHGYCSFFFRESVELAEAHLLHTYWTQPRGPTLFGFDLMHLFST